MDFYCPSKKLVIEIDGPVHQKQKEYDHEREEYLKEMGYQVLRFENNQVVNHLEAIMKEIFQILKHDGTP